MESDEPQVDDLTDDEEFAYEEVVIESDEEGQAGEQDDLELALRTAKQLNVRAAAASADVGDRSAPAPGTASRRPEMMDDFVRNFLCRTGMQRSLEIFETEWYEMSASRASQQREAMLPVPELYSRITELEDTVRSMEMELAASRSMEAKATTTWEVLRKERDFHRMHHKRIGQEKNTLISELKRLRAHYAQYEPTIKELRDKYEVLMKEKNLGRLERDRLLARCVALETALAPTMEEPKLQQPSAPAGETVKKTIVKGPSLPTSMVNPTLSEGPPEPADVAKYRLQKTFKGHALGVSNIAMHPKKPIMATASDDRTWKLWSLPGGELIMSGEGHTDWVVGLSFHPAGTHLASSSGDATVKIWEFEKRKCILTLADHTQAVWSVAYHSAGDFLASGSLDHSARLWDVAAGKCKQAFRGHVDSVNEVCWQPYTNVLATASSDKTVSLWDGRNGLCAQTFYGHNNSCNHVAFTSRGYTLASCDADGLVKVWDVRTGAEVLTANCGPHPANKVAFDRSGDVVSVASDDGKVKFISTVTGEELHELEGHDDAVQCGMFDLTGKMFVSGGSDKTYRIWGN